MKILLVTRGYPQPHNKGLGIFERDQAIALKRAGHKVAYGVVDIRSVRRKRKFGYNHFTDENGIDVFEMSWPIGPVPRSLIEFFRQEALMELYLHVLKEFGRPDIVHSHFLNYGVIAVKLCKKENLPLVVTEHSSYMNRGQLPWWVKKRALKTYSACDSVIAVSESLAKNIKESTGHDCVVVHNIANISDNIEALRENNKNSEILFVSAGNLLFGKGFDILFQAFAKVLKEEDKIKLLVLGDGPERKRLISLVSRLKISDYVNFYGKYRKEDLPKICKDANAFVLASRAETFGVVYIEAMSMGLPVIATRCGGPEDFVNDSNGYLVDVEDVDGLANALNKMIYHWNEFDKYKIVEYAKVHFSSEVIADEITKVYKDVLDKRS